MLKLKQNHFVIDMKKKGMGERLVAKEMNDMETVNGRVAQNRFKCFKERISCMENKNKNSSGTI